MADRYEFDRATEVREIAAPTGAPATSTSAHRTGELAEGWDVRGIPNGGYLLSVAAAALRDDCGQPDPLAVGAHFLRPTRPGPLALQVHPGHRGRRHATAALTGFQARRPAPRPGQPAGPRPLLPSEQAVVQATGTFTDLGLDRGGPERIDRSPSALPEPDSCVARRGFADQGLGQRLDLRLHPDDAGFGDGRPSGLSRMRGWIRFSDGRPPDTLALLLFADAFPPAVFNAGLPIAWVPTVQLSVQVRTRPVTGWIRAEFTTRTVTGGYLEEDGVLWDDADRLVAQSRQLAAAPRPDGPPR